MTHDRKNIDRLHFINIKNFCSVKYTIKRRERQASVWMKYLWITYMSKDLYPEFKKQKIKNPKFKLNNKTKTIQLKWWNIWTDLSPSKHTKWCSVVITEMQIKTMMWYYHIPFRIVKQKQKSPKICSSSCCRGCRAMEILIQCWRECPVVEPLETVWQFCVGQNIHVRWPSNPTLRYLHKWIENMFTKKPIYTQMFMETLLVITPNWNLKRTFKIPGNGNASPIFL